VAKVLQEQVEIKAHQELVAKVHLAPQVKVLQEHLV
jgi:hypothetical protein